MQKLVFFIVLLLTQSILAQVPNQIGGRANGLANTALLNADVWAVKNGLGALGTLSQNSIGIAYQNRFLVTEMANQSLAFNYHIGSKSNLGLYYQQTGFSLYKQLQTGLAYGMKLADNFSMGVALNFHRVVLGDVYGSKNALSASIGLIYALNSNIDLGVNINNLNRAKLDDFQDERFPTIYNVGLKYKFSEGTFWSIEAEKDILHPVNIKSGIEIKTHDIFVVRIGVNSFPFLASMGAGINIKGLQIDIASSWHTNLGLNPAMSLKYNF